MHVKIGKKILKAIRPFTLYEAKKIMAIKKQHIHKIRVARWMNDTLRIDKIRYVCILWELRVAPMGDNMRESQLRWFGLLQWKP